jgi:hypothetical protein
VTAFVFELKQSRYPPSGVLVARIVVVANAELPKTIDPTMNPIVNLALPNICDS